MAWTKFRFLGGCYPTWDTYNVRIWRFSIQSATNCCWRIITHVQRGRESLPTKVCLPIQREGGWIFFCVDNKWLTPYEIILFFHCGWIKDEKNELLVPVMFPDHTPPTPDALLERIWCNCAIDKPCSRGSCSCTNTEFSCTKFCKCYSRTCFNSWTVQKNSDYESEDELELEYEEWCLKMNL